MDAFGFNTAYYDDQEHSAFFQSISLDEAVYFPNDSTSIDRQDMIRRKDENGGKGPCGFTVDRARE